MAYLENQSFRAWHLHFDRVMTAASALVLCAAVLLVHACYREHSMKERGRALDHSFYIWQRSWSDALTDAVDTARPYSSEFVVLAAEIAWRGSAPGVFKPAIRYDGLRKAGRPVGLAVRIGPIPKNYRLEGDSAELVSHLVRSLIADAESAGIHPAELQLDFDCAESRLEEYAAMLRMVRPAAGGVPLTITALPCWLDRSAFKELIDAADGYVLQVHSTDKPEAGDKNPTICNVASAGSWVKQAARLGRPFRVALSTYSYVATFDEQGRLASLSAEGRGAVPVLTGQRVIRSDASAIAGLVQGWNEERPAGLTGVVWYRLPLATDSLNWRWETVWSIIAGNTPMADLRVHVARSEPELFDIELVNAGDADAGLPGLINVDWKGRLVSCDGLLDYGVSVETNGARFVLSDRHRDVIAPGERLRIGWLRLETDAEVAVNASILN